MQPNKPIIAIIGSARAEIMGAKENDARLAAQAIGEALAKGGWRLAVYGSSTDFIEHDVVKGYINAGLNEPKSIVCIYPGSGQVDFSYIPNSKDYFEMHVDRADDWEVSFYRSISTKVDAVLLFGGAQSAFIAGQIAVARGFPIIAVAHFGGSSRKIWKDLSDTSGNLTAGDVQIMGQWTSNSPKEFVDSLNGQYERGQKRIAEQKQKALEVQNRADAYEKLMLEKKSSRTKMAALFLLAFITFFILGLAATIQPWMYSALTVIGLCIAGGMGASVRMITANPVDAASKWNAPLIGIVVGLVFSIVYLIPQFVQNTSILTPDSTEGITRGMRAQFICSIIVAALAGLGFDYAMDQLVKKAQRDVEKIAQNTP